MPLPLRMGTGELAVGLLVLSLFATLGAVPAGAQSEGVTFLDETFDSWASIDPGWSVRNGTRVVLDTYFDLDDGVLVGSNRLKYPVSTGDYTDAVANWSSPVSYPGGLIISYDIYIPSTFPQVIGYVGNVFHVTAFGMDGVAAISTRFGSADWSGGPPGILPTGFAYYNGSAWIRLNELTWGWHAVSYVLEKSSTTWTAYFDGVAYAGLAYAVPETGGPDLSKLQIGNGLREEVQSILLDNLRIFEGTDPGAWNTPPSARFSIDPSIGNTGVAFNFDASSSSDRQDTTPMLLFRWDWEDDGVYDTSPTSVATANHVYPGPGVYRVRLEVIDSGGFAAELARPLVVMAYNRTFLMESFSSWAEVKASWLVTNGTWFEAGPCPTCQDHSGIWNYFAVADGRLAVDSEYATGYFGGFPGGRSNAIMDWTSGAIFSTTLETFAQFYLPSDPLNHVPYGIGAGGTMTLQWFDFSGTTPISVQTSFTPDYTWALSDGTTGARLATLPPGWHTISVRMTKGETTWTLKVDGLTFEGLGFAGGGSAFDLAKLRVLNTFYEAGGGVSVDHLAIGEIYPASGGNTPPAAYFDVTPTLGNGSTVFATDASRSVDAQDPTSDLLVRWDWEGDGLFDTDWTLEKTADHRYPVGGAYGVTLEVQDAGGLSSATSRSIRVDTTPPVAVAGPDFIAAEGAWVTFDGSASYDDMGIRSYVWTFVDGTLHTLSEVRTGHLFANPGTFDITLTVTDFAGNVGTDTLTLVVQGTLWAEAGPDRTVLAGDTVTFDGSLSSGLRGPLQYAWTFTENGVQRTLDGMQPSYVFEYAGQYLITLKVTDATGIWKTDTATLNVLQNGTLITRTPPSEKSEIRWNFTAAATGNWHLTVVNLGFRSMVLEIYDVTAGPAMEFWDETIRFRSWDAYPVGVVHRTVPFEAGHVYTIVVRGVRGSVGSELVLRQWYAVL